MTVVPYEAKYKAAFLSLNRRWIEEMFTLEAEDLREMENIEPYLARGGNIFFTLDDIGEVMACCMVAPRDDGDWEIMKLAAAGMYTGTGAGNACLQACIRYARERGVKKLLIVSNRRCVQAVHLYRKNGFTEIPVNRRKFPFDRADIAFEQRWD